MNNLLKKLFIQINKNDLKDFALSSEALIHSKSYSELLDIYVSATKRNMVMKDIYKFLFFLSTMGSLLFIVFIFYKTLNYSFKIFNYQEIQKISIEMVLSVIAVIVPAMSSLIVAFIKIPKIIAKYLFNVQEENYMDSIIKNLQIHDQSMFALEHKLDIALAENKEDASDDEFEASPQKKKKMVNVNE